MTTTGTTRPQPSDLAMTAHTARTETKRLPWRRRSSPALVLVVALAALVGGGSNLAIASAANANSSANRSSPPTKHHDIQKELKFAKCMRSHGITNFPDPTPHGQLEYFGDTNSPQFRTAAQACRWTGVHWNGP